MAFKKKITPSKPKVSKASQKVQSTAQLLQGITPAKLEKLAKIPTYIKDSKPSKMLGVRHLEDVWIVAEQLDKFFEIEIAPSIVGLAVYLGISKNTLYKILAGDIYKDLEDLMQIAVDRIEANVVRGMLNGYLQPVGSIFYLKNNHGYSDNKGAERDSNISAVQVNIQVNGAAKE